MLEQAVASGSAGFLEHHAGRAEQVEREGRPMSCCLLPLTTLAIEASGPGVWPRESAVMVRALVSRRPFALHVPVGETRPHRAILIAGPSSSVEPLRKREQLVDVGRPTAAHRDPLVHQRGDRDLPAVADAAQPLGSGMRTLVKNTSLKSEAPVICLIGRISMPGLFMSTKKKVRPLCFASVGSWRVTRMPQSE